VAEDGFVRGKPFHIKPTHIVAGRQQTFGPGGGGGYTGLNGGWGLQEGPRRGEGGPPKIKPITLPSVMQEFMNDQVHSQAEIESAYNARFNSLVAETEREWEESKNAAKGTRALSPLDSAVVDQQVTLDLVNSKNNLYTATAPSIYGLFGQSPFYLMEVLPRQKMRDFLNAGFVDSQGLLGLYALFDDVYKSALELKVLSLSIDVLRFKLSGLSNSRSQVESLIILDDVALFAAQNERLNLIGLELEIHSRQLPEFLQAELVAAAGSLSGLNQTQVLRHYQVTLDRMAATKMSEIQPVVAPPPIKGGGITLNFLKENPKIKPPLSKPELEALNELVYLQNHTPIGTKWISYHDALLKAESARHLTSTSKAFGELSDRSSDAEQIQSAIKFTVDFYKEVSEKFGGKAAALAKHLSSGAKGKTIRNAEEAIKAFDKYGDVLTKKFSAQDREAIAKAIEALDKEMMAKTLEKFAKGFGLVGYTIDVIDLSSEARKSTENGDWKPFFVKVETIVAGQAVTGLLAFMFSLTALTPVGIVGYALLMAVTSSFIDDELVGVVNEFIISI
jgi:hypothetical protein